MHCQVPVNYSPPVNCTWKISPITGSISCLINCEIQGFSRQSDLRAKHLTIKISHMYLFQYSESCVSVPRCSPKSNSVFDLVSIRLQFRCYWEKTFRNITWQNDCLSNKMTRKFLEWHLDFKSCITCSSGFSVCHAHLTHDPGVEYSTCNVCKNKNFLKTYINFTVLPTQFYIPRKSMSRLQSQNLPKESLPCHRRKNWNHWCFECYRFHGKAWPLTRIPLHGTWSRRSRQVSVSMRKATSPFNFFSPSHHIKQHFPLWHIASP